MNQYREKHFNIGNLNSISKNQIEEHLKLYTGYVDSVNLIEKKVSELRGVNSDTNYIISELRRRLSFEFNGMRMHEYYFEQLEGGYKKLNPQGLMAGMFLKECGGFGAFLDKFKEISMSRGIGWAAFCYDKENQTPHIIWIDSHNVGQLCGLSMLLVIDMWEHAYMVDYKPSEKKKYINTFFENLNWEVVEHRFEKVVKGR